jgi:predicted DNA-binding transcriptional regulator YafY
MRRADRLFQIVQYLRGGRLVTANDLAQRLEVSKRTIYRDTPILWQLVSPSMAKLASEISCDLGMMFRPSCSQMMKSPRW